MDALHLQEVKVLNSDPLGARNVFVKSSKREFVTPQRVLTSTESNHRTNIMTFIPFAEAFENPVFELVGHFNENEVHELWHRNGIFDARMRAYRSHSRRYSEMITKFFPRIVASRSLAQSDIRALVDLQLSSEFDIITIPDPSVNGSMKQFEKNLDVFADYVKNAGSEPMPYVDMSNDNDIFRKKIRRVAGNIRYQMPRARISLILSILSKFPGNIRDCRYGPLDSLFQCPQDAIKIRTARRGTSSASILNRHIRTGIVQSRRSSQSKAS